MAPLLREVSAEVQHYVAASGLSRMPTRLELRLAGTLSQDFNSQGSDSTLSGGNFKPRSACTPNWDITCLVIRLACAPPAHTSWLFELRQLRKPGHSVCSRQLWPRAHVDMLESGCCRLPTLLPLHVRILQYQTIWCVQDARTWPML